MKNYLKLIAILIVRLALKSLYIFPVKKNRILFSAYEGMQYACNPKYIFEYIMGRSHEELEIIWCLNKADSVPEKFRDRVRTVKFMSLMHIYNLMTAGVIISNFGIEPFVPKRRSQMFVNTWHGGGAYKRVKYDINIFSRSRKFYSRVLRNLRSRSTDVFLASCKKFEEISSEDFGIPRERFVETGMPRNDYLVRKDSGRIKQLRLELSKEFCIDENTLWVLYAPTFRGLTPGQQKIDNALNKREVIKSLELRFGKRVSFMCRSHVAKNQSFSKVEGCCDVSSYQDMQLLIEACDVLITDYSSSMWDFALTLKPCFLYVPDLEEYEDGRGLYTPIDTWAHDYAKSVEELCRIIEEYDPMKSRKKIEKHLRNLGSFEQGCAREQVYSIIMKRVLTGK